MYVIQKGVAFYHSVTEESGEVLPVFTRWIEDALTFRTKDEAEEALNELVSMSSVGTKAKVVFMMNYDEIYVFVDI